MKPFKYNVHTWCECLTTLRKIMNSVIMYYEFLVDGHERQQQQQQKTAASA